MLCMPFAHDGKGGQVGSKHYSGSRGVQRAEDLVNELGGREGSRGEREGDRGSDEASLDLRVDDGVVAILGGLGEQLMDLR